MIGIDPEAALEILDARDFYDARRAGLGPEFVTAANDTLDAIDAAPAGSVIVFPRRRRFRQPATAP
jgi:hypothetical protein